MGQGLLQIVATPIGNLGDLSSRGKTALEEADLVACEDTRHTGLLLSRIGLKKNLLSLHEHNEASRIASILDHLEAGETVVLVSDAGHPGLSDPGQRLVHAVSAHGAQVEVVPGPCALPTAISGSGFPCEKFHFGGFLPPKSGRRLRELQEATDREYTSIFFESPHRILKSLVCLAELAPERKVCVARELTKKFETYHHGKAQELAEEFANRKAKGEIVLLVSGSKPPKWFLRDRPEKEAQIGTDQT